MRKLLVILALGVAVTAMVSSCKDYDDQLNEIGRRIDAIKDTIYRYERTTDTILHVLRLIPEQGFISSIDENDTAFVLHMTGTFGSGAERDSLVNLPKDAVNGKDGTGLSELLGVKKDDDGHFYWTFGGDWLLDDNDDKVLAEGIDGKDGEDADPYTGKVFMPEIRVSSDGTPTWWVTFDGVNWRDTHQAANGKNGTNGRNGRNGSPDPVVLNVQIDDATGDVIILVLLTNGNQQTVVIPQYIS